jgi:hypothetical protein
MFVLGRPSQSYSNKAQGLMFSGKVMREAPKCRFFSDDVRDVKKKRFITSAQDEVEDEEFLDEDDEEEGIGEIDDGKTGKLTLGALLQVPVSLKEFFLFVIANLSSSVCLCQVFSGPETFYV